ncbi:DinB family protein [Muricauda sp. CAU 1633]|uniref:DinB family protein n=1 Tax=Allomuricauda sp. CAU 1633 TaxID=2816036 RepID=UPI001A8F3927|nr:DinB family protein [Muricauda sp. CAU 1633]MBO0323301.1 DinB family protein [Muricauda sp. CAU 1633]
MLRSELPSSEYNPFYQTYLLALDDVDLIQELNRGRDEFTTLLEGVPESKLGYAYGEGKWTLAEVLLHIMDAERVFQYRALCFARNDKTPFPGFDQDEYVPESNASARTKDDLLQEYKAIRESTLCLYNSFDEEVLKRIGMASGSQMSVRAMGFIISGHQAHHLKIIRKKYL